MELRRLRNYPRRAAHYCLARVVIVASRRMRLDVDQARNGTFDRQPAALAAGFPNSERANRVFDDGVDRVGRGELPEVPDRCGILAAAQCQSADRATRRR